MPSLSDLLGQWRDDLAGWAIPEHITSAVAESPWVLPRDVFARRADRLRRDPGGPSFERAFEALDPPGFARPHHNDLRGKAPKPPLPTEKTDRDQHQTPPKRRRP